MSKYKIAFIKESLNAQKG